MIRHFAAAVALAGLAALTFGPSIARAQDASDVVVRLSQLEDQMRRMSGKIEELQFQNQQLRDQLKRLQQDTDFRFQEMGGKGPSQAATPRPVAPSAPPRQIAVDEPPAPAGPSPAAPRRSRDDAFDPRANPDAPGAPRPLGSPEPSLPAAARRPGVPASIMEDPDSPRRGPETPLDIAGAGGPPPSTPHMQPPPAATGTPSARADYDSAYSYYQQRQYEQAEMGFRSFLQSHPRSKLVPDATYWLGESYLQRARYRDAAEQFLKITTAYGTSPRAPDGMFKLGVSLHGLGAHDQACATLAEVTRKYPSARASLVREIQRERERAKCTS
jgi:tol-pal system protein YbgF